LTELKLRQIIRFFWALFLVTLPVTSFPYFPPAIGGEALVRPLAVFPLIILVPLVLFPVLYKKPVPRISLALFPILLVAGASSLLSLLRGIEPALGISVEARILRGMFTLIIGCAVYLTVSILPEKPGDLRFSMRWIYAGCGIALAWSSLQVLNIVRFNSAWFEFLSGIQQHISTRRLLPDRISGLTYEPHWFAEQMVLLLLPGLIASSISGYSLFKWRWRWLSVERLGLGWVILILPFTFSRAGLLNLLILLVVGTILFSRLEKPLSDQALIKKSKRLSRLLAGITLTLIVVILPIILAGAKNSFFSRLWLYWTRENTSISGYLTSLGFDARLAYSQAAYNTYKEHPLLGVGLGNYAFYLEEMLPYRPLAYIPEVLRVITPEYGRDRLVTSKNFYLRLLAETGIVGLIVFLAFIVAHIGIAMWLWLSPNNEEKFWGAVSLLGLTAFIFSAFTFDSFVIPNMWVVFGMITAAYTVYKFRKVNSEEVPLGGTSQAENLSFHKLKPADGSAINE
jgi:hypothetical protein